jgi:S-adenosylmethionine decarboxylase
MRALGRHLLLELYACPPDRLNDVKGIEACLLEAVRRIGATLISHQTHRFSPHGVSAVVIIAESHLTIHTWPEHGYAAVDLFTCSDRLNPQAGLDHICSSLEAGHSSLVTLERGLRLVE